MAYCDGDVWVNLGLEEANDRSLTRVLVGRWRAPENGKRRTERAGPKGQTFHGHGAPLRGDG